MANEAQAYSLPPPVGGWNVADRLEAMPETDAVRLDNWFPDTDGVNIRRGSTLISAGIGDDPVRMVHSWVGAGGSTQLIGAGGSQVFRVASGGSAIAIGGSFGSAAWSPIQVRNNTLLLNGVDTPQLYNGSSLAAATFTSGTSTSLTATKLVAGTIHQSRPWLIEAGSATVWYGATNAIQGALTDYPLTSLLKRGGYILNCASWSTDSGNGFGDYICFISSEGEVLVYQGSDPSDTTTPWRMILRGFIPKPLGRKSIGNLGTDVVVLTEHGLVPLNQAFLSAFKSGAYENLTRKIDPAIADAATRSRAYEGWCFVTYPLGRMLIINVPISQDNVSHQYVYNTFTRATCRFIGMNAASWCLHDNRPYFGSTDGKIYRADYGGSDGDAYIAVDVETAFNFLGAPNARKAATAVRPSLEATDGTEFFVGTQWDFSRDVIQNTVTVTGAPGLSWPFEWDSPWGGSLKPYNYWEAVTGNGRAVSVRLRAKVKDVEAKLAALDVMYILGGVL